MDNRLRLSIIAALILLVGMFYVDSRTSKSGAERKPSALQRELQQSIDHLDDIFDIVKPDRIAKGVKTLGEAWQRKTQAIDALLLAQTLPKELPASMGPWLLSELNTQGGGEKKPGLSFAAAMFHAINKDQTPATDGAVPAQSRTEITVFDVPTLEVAASLFGANTELAKLSQSETKLAGYSSSEHSPAKGRSPENRDLVASATAGTDSASELRSDDAQANAEIVVQIRPHLFVHGTSNTLDINQLRLVVNTVDFNALETLVVAAEKKARAVVDKKATDSNTQPNENSTQATP
ncbi:MAG: hypothetical protein HKM24_01425 [Gammaproteobacteria bacterium]|nr:hypothetical protein [Gammaproteobacteria bacterium]